MGNNCAKNLCLPNQLDEPLQSQNTEKPKKPQDDEDFSIWGIPNLGETNSSISTVMASQMSSELQSNSFEQQLNVTQPQFKFNQKKNQKDKWTTLEPINKNYAKPQENERKQTREELLLLSNFSNDHRKERQKQELSLIEERCSEHKYSISGSSIQQEINTNLMRKEFNQQSGEKSCQIQTLNKEKLQYQNELSIQQQNHNPLEKEKNKLTTKLKKPTYQSEMTGSFQKQQINQEEPFDLIQFQNDHSLKLHKINEKIHQCQGLIIHLKQKKKLLEDQLTNVDLSNEQREEIQKKIHYEIIKRLEIYEFREKEYSKKWSELFELLQDQIKFKKQSLPSDFQT